MTFFFAHAATGKNFPNLTVANPSVGNCPSEPTTHVGQSRLNHSLTDGEREAAIALAASLIEHHMELYEISGNFADRGNADRARLSMEALIKGRSAEFVAKLERERGLA